ncbi:hypothetical protein PAXRUDRAFT_86168, partial [Paxillus rubicundulus Ve08.2h10]
AANWSDEETTALLEFLIGELPKAGDGANFKKTAWTAAALLMSTRFKVTKGGQMKKQFEAVVALKNASGFTYSDKDGAGITLA